MERLAEREKDRVFADVMLGLPQGLGASHDRTEVPLHSQEE